MIDRTEAAGAGVSIVGHVALVAALALFFATRPSLPVSPPAIEVSFEEEVGLVSSAPASQEPPAPAQGLEMGSPEQASGADAPIPDVAEPPPPAPAPAPGQSGPRDRPEQSRREVRRNVPTQTRPPVQSPPQRTPTRQTNQRQTQGRPDAGERSRGNPLPSPDSFRDEPGRNARPAAVMTGQARADIGSVIQRQVQPCAVRQRPPAPEALQIVTDIRLRLTREGRLAGAPEVVGQSGINNDNRRYADLVRERAILAFRQCSPLRNLPQELYDVRGGWQTFTLRFRFPG